MIHRMIEPPVMMTSAVFVTDFYCFGAASTNLMESKTWDALMLPPESYRPSKWETS